MQGLQLHLRAVEATDCAKMDVRSSDPYLKIMLSTNNDTRKTRVCKSTLQPRWNEEFHFPVPNQANAVLKIEMWDQDAGSADDQMSRLDVQLCSLQIGAVLDQWYDMTPVHGVKKGGRVHLVLHLAPSGAAPFVNAPQKLDAGAPGYPPAGAPPGYPPAGAPPGYPPAGAPPGYPPAGAPPGYPPAGAPPGYPPAGAPPGYPPAGAPPGYPPAGAPPGYPPAGAPPGYPPAGAPPGAYPPAGAPPGYPPAGAPGYPPAGAPPGAYPPAGSAPYPPGGYPPAGAQGYPPAGQGFGGLPPRPPGMSDKDYKKLCKKQKKAMKKQLGL